MFKCNSWDNLQYQLYIILGRNSATHPKQGPEQKSWKPKVASNVTSIHIIHSILWYHPRDKGGAAKMWGREYQLCGPVCWSMLVDNWPVDYFTNLILLQPCCPSSYKSWVPLFGIGKYLGNALLLAASPQTVADPELTGVEEESSEEVMPSCKCDVNRL